jgi:putative transposase
MPRTRRVIIPGVAHHITQRGNNQQKVFFNDEDFCNYCFWANKYAAQYQIDILAYCLMPNHIHLIAIPYTKIGMSRFCNTVNMRHAQYINHKKNTNGHLWQSRFFSCPLDDIHLYFALRYEEQNPIRAGLTNRPWDYAWSSVRFHVGMDTNAYIRIRDMNMMNHNEWKKYLGYKDESMDETIRENTYSGKACAVEENLKEWEKTLNCVLRSKKAGRPRKEDIA